jgi:DNA-binding SARP family transcriptional activator
VRRALTRAWRLLRAVAGIAVIAALLAGLPYGLAAMTGSPLPRTWPGWAQAQRFLASPLSDDAIIRFLADAAWLLWAAFALSLVIELIAVTRGQPAPRLPAIAPVQALAAALVGATMMTALHVPRAQTRSTPPLHAALTSATSISAPLVPGHPARQGTAVSGTAIRAASDDSHNRTARPKVYRVKEGDDLWAIAARFLGDPERWHEIYDLNAGRPQPDGLELTDPNYIQVGWVLLIPPEPGHAGATPGTSPHHARPPSPSRQPAPASPRHPSPAPTTARPAPSHAPSAHASTGTHQRHGSTVLLPSGAIIGLSLAIAAGLALLLARLNRRRRREPAEVPGTAPAEPELTPALRSIRQAHLAASRQPPADDTDPGLHLAAPYGTPPGDGIPPRHGPSTETVNVAVSDDGEEIPLDLGCVPGTGLTGMGAADVIRAIAITLLARRARDQAEVVLCGEQARRLLTLPADGQPLPEVPGLAAFSVPDDALGRLEAEIIHRRRLLDDSDADELTAYRDADPDEPLPTILVIAPADSPKAGRLAAVLALGQRLGIIGILAGPWPSGATCQVARNGVVTSVSAQELARLDGAQMYQLSAEETAEILTMLAGASGAAPAGMETGQPRVVHAPPAEAPGAAAAHCPVRVDLLGPFLLTADGEPVTKGLRRKAAELLIYLAIHRNGATSGAILDALWQDTPAVRAAPILHAATTNIRKILRDATGASEAAFIVRAADQLRIDPHLITTDLWQFQDALASAAHAAGDQDRLASLRAAADLWHGDIGTGFDSIWLDEYRETSRRDAVDTLARLAELSEPGDPEQALAYLERAITIDRYQEPLYRRIMRLQGTLGRPDAARRTYQLLESRLTEIEAEPDELTARLLSEILHRRDAP